ncbi:MAG: Asp-tRNA(Asn)/Glu-tRNA(Gln) amidotransferase subunit GatC [Varibaculum sp.]|nr:Asp-tRNA(Asn)/Glu-tRNA(Gln) amidotransferase subunit GatC [Varibaculum sp.]
MSTIDETEVRRVAQLSRLHLSEAEITRIAGQLGQIADAVAKVSEVATPDVAATSHPVEIVNVLRPDTPTETLDRDELLAAAPDAQDGQFRVPQILGEE